MTRTNFTSILLISTTITFALSACGPCEPKRFGTTDVIVDGPEFCSDEETAGDDCSPEPGEAMGPCRTEGELCDDDMLCRQTPGGSFCEPPCIECPQGLHDACIDTLSTTSRSSCDGNGACYLPCFDDAGCAGGTVCVKEPGVAGLCVWPD